MKAGWSITYNGGEVTVDPARIDSILIYGATGSPPVPFLDELATHRVPLLIHCRNLPDPYVFVPGARRDDNDILSAQIRARDNQTKCSYVARTLIRARFRATPYPIATSMFRQLAATRSVAQVRQIEAEQSRVYWERYFEKAGLDEESRQSVFVPSHRTTVRRKNLLHGVVLALRSWLIGESSRFVVPVEGAPIGGRRPKQGYRLPGTTK